MTETKPNIKPTIYAYYGLGLTLAVIGAVMTMIGFNRAGQSRIPVTPGIASETGNPSAPVETPPNYRLRYSDDRWSIQPAGGGPKVSLPSFLPGPSLCAAPRGAVPIEEIQSVFLDCLERNRFPLTRERYAVLTAIRIGERELFVKRERLKALLPDGVEPEPRAETRAEKVPESKKTKPEAVKTRTEETSRLTSIPERLDPASDLFLEAMSEWKTLIAEPLQNTAPEPRGYPVTATLPGTGEVVILFSGRARERVLSDSFGSTKRDKAIYLQALFGQGGEKILVDGAFRNNSKKALNRWARRQFVSEDLATDYQKRVEAYF